VRADVSLKGELAAAAEATLAHYGKVHIRVNNAGGGGGGGPYGMWSDARGTGRGREPAGRRLGHRDSSAR